jgi:putative oxidoreductase
MNSFIIMFLVNSRSVYGNPKMVAEIRTFMNTLRFERDYSVCLERLKSIAMTIQSVARLVFTLILAKLFWDAGFAKVDWAPLMVHNCQRWGYPLYFVQIIGFTEMMGAALLLFPRTASAAATLLGTIAAGAAFNHLRFGEYSAIPIPLAMNIVCLFVVYWFRKSV